MVRHQQEMNEMQLDLLSTTSLPQLHHSKSQPSVVMVSYGGSTIEEVVHLLLSPHASLESTGFLVDFAILLKRVLLHRRLPPTELAALAVHKWYTTLDLVVQI